MEKSLPAIPAKRYFTIGEVSELCAVKPYVLRYWEQEFTQLKPMKRRGNRRYYQHHEVLLIRRIRELLYDQGFTISGARNRLGDVRAAGPLGTPPLEADAEGGVDGFLGDGVLPEGNAPALAVPDVARAGSPALSMAVPSGAGLVGLRAELLSIRELLTV
jgi:DNA-binding transcriptional MerR regulator